MPYVHPLPGGRDARNFGQDRGDHIHAGTDISAPTGTPLYAVTDGRVSVKPLNGAAGNTLDLRAANGDLFRYFHLSGYSVIPGQSVTAGQQVGKVGSTGRSTGPHLHFEYHPGGGPAADPTPILTGTTAPGNVPTTQPVGAIPLVPIPGASTVGLLADPRSWLRLTMVVGGGLLVAVGLAVIVNGTKAGGQLRTLAIGAGKTAALGPAGAAL